MTDFHSFHEALNIGVADMNADNSSTDEPRAGRPLLDGDQPRGFVRYPYYTVKEVALVLAVSEDFVRALFRGGRHGCVPELVNPRPGKRDYRTVLIPYQTLVGFIDSHTVGEMLQEGNAPAVRRLRRA